MSVLRYHHVVSAGLFCSVQGFVGKPDKLNVIRRIVGRQCCNADTDGNGNACSRKAEIVLLNAPADQLTKGGRITDSGLWQNERKFVATVAAGKILRAEYARYDRGQGF